MATLTQNHFDRSQIPSARTFYERELGKLARPDRRGWAAANCPFHKSKSGRSFSVNVESGGFHCFGCDARGGDLIAFMRKRYRLSFPEAAKHLGCWKDEGLDQQVQKRITDERKEREREAREQQERKEQERGARILARDILHHWERLYQQAKEQHDVELMADLLPHVRMAEEEYWKLSGLEVRHEF